MAAAAGSMIDAVYEGLNHGVGPVEHHMFVVTFSLCHNA
jgi:hypothetical protein